MIKTTMAIVVMLVMASPALAEEMQMHHHMMGRDMITDIDMHKSGMPRTNDQRASLNLPAPMRRKQLAMMREHLQAVDDIIAYLARGKFNAASKTAHSKLGLTPEMKKMCNMLGRRNSDFRAMGLTFHKNADKLADALKTGNMERSLSALHATIHSCVQCHATFRQ